MKGLHLTSQNGGSGWGVLWTFVLVWMLTPQEAMEAAILIPPVVLSPNFPYYLLLFSLHPHNSMAAKL
jgi:hypothetical protein